MHILQYLADLLRPVMLNLVFLIERALFYSPVAAYASLFNALLAVLRSIQPTSSVASHQ